MKALLLSAGKGTRLHPFTHAVPKGLVPVQGIPLIAYWLESLMKSPEISGVLINLHHLSESIEEFIRKSPYASFVQFFYEESLLGTGGTLLANKDFFGEEDIMLVHADNLSHFEVDEFVQVYKGRPSSVEACMMSFMTTDPGSCGILELDDKGLVQKFHEKVKNPPGNLANAAVYIFSPRIFELLERKGSGVIDISTEILPDLMGRLNTFHNLDYHRDIGNIESLLSAQLDFPHRYMGDRSLLGNHPLHSSENSQAWVESLDAYCQNTGRPFFVFDEYSKDIESQLLGEKNSFNKDSLIVFRRAPSDFTSYDFYKRTELASFVFSTTG